MKRYIFFIASFLVALSANAGHVTTIEIQKGERWWGVFVSGAPVEPFGAPFAVRTDTSAMKLLRPVLLSSNSRYLYSSEPAAITFDGTKITVETEGQKAEVYKGGRTLREAYLVCCHKNFPPTGRTPALEYFTMPLYETRMHMGFTIDQVSVSEYAHKLREEGFASGIIVICDGWRQAGGYGFDPVRFPDPKTMVEGLHELGFKVMLTVTPYEAAYGRSYLDGKKNGLFVNDPEGVPIEIRTPEGIAVAYGVTSEAVGAGIRSALNDNISRYGIDGYRFDCNRVLGSLGGGPEAVDYLRAWREIGEEYAMTDYRGVFDEPLADFLVSDQTGPGPHEKILQVVNDYISAGITGFPYSHFSIYGDSFDLTQADDKQKAEWLLLEASLPVTKVPFAPWSIEDSELYSAVQNSLRVRFSLADYLRELAEESARTGEPLVRHMEYQFPKSGFSDCDTQFMLGPRYLLVPARNLDGPVTVRLPKGNWTDRDGKRMKGPLVTQVDRPESGIIIFELANK